MLHNTPGRRVTTTRQVIASGARFGRGGGHDDWALGQGSPRVPCSTADGYQLTARGLRVKCGFVLDAAVLAARVCSVLL